MDDIAGEILVRLPVESLVRCKALSKDAYDFISHNQSFRQKYLSRNPGSIMFGLFHSLIRPYHDKFESVHFFPTTTQGKRRRTTRSLTSNNKSSFPVYDEALSFLGLGSHQQIHIAGSSNGFLLCTLQLLDPVDYIICNPITKQWLSLPHPRHMREFIAHGFLWRSADNYTVVRGMESYEMDNNGLTIEIFAPQTSSQQWKLLDLNCPFSFTLDFSYVSITIVNRDGVIYLPAYLQKRPNQSIDENHLLLILDQRKKELECLQLLDFPQPETNTYNCKLFGQSNEHILYAFYEEAFLRLKVFVLDEKARQWSPMHNIGMDMAPEHYREDMDIAAFHPTNPQLLILQFDRELVLCNLGNSTLELICDLFAQRWSRDYYIYPYSYGLIGPHLFFDP